MALQLFLAIVLTVLAALAAATESAVSRIGKSRANDLVAQGHRGAPALAAIAADPAPAISVATKDRSIFNLSIGNSRSKNSDE